MYKANPAEAMPIRMTTPASGLAERLTALNPSDHVTKLVCHDPWVSLVLAVITVAGLVVYLYQNCKHLTLMKGHRFASICHVHLVIGNDTRYVPFKIGQFVGLPFLFEYSSSPKANQITLQKELLWDHIHIAWQNQKVFYKKNKIPLKEHVTVPLKDKIRLRNILGKTYHTMFKVKQGDTWYNLTHKTNPDLNPQN